MTILIQQQYKVEKMNIKPIKTETDYTEALQIAESLMGAKS